MSENICYCGQYIKDPFVPGEEQPSWLLARMMCLRLYWLYCLFSKKERETHRYYKAWCLVIENCNCPYKGE